MNKKFKNICIAFMAGCTVCWFYDITCRIIKIHKAVQKEKQREAASIRATQNALDKEMIDLDIDDI